MVLISRHILETEPEPPNCSGDKWASMKVSMIQQVSDIQNLSEKLRHILIAYGY
jgi:hypothetical protein